MPLPFACSLRLPKYVGAPLSAVLIARATSLKNTSYAAMGFRTKRLSMRNCSRTIGGHENRNRSFHRGIDFIRRDRLKGLKQKSIQPFRFK